MIETCPFYSEYPKCGFELANGTFFIKVCLDGECLCIDHRQHLRLFFLKPTSQLCRYSAVGGQIFMSARPHRDVFVNSNVLFTSISVASAQLNQDT